MQSIDCICGGTDKKEPEALPFSCLCEVNAVNSQYGNSLPRQSMYMSGYVLAPSSDVQ